MGRYDKERQVILDKIRSLDKGIAKLGKSGKHIEVTSLVALKKKYMQALESTDNIERAYDLLTSSKDLNGWLSKTLGLAIATADLSYFYADMANRFFERHELLQSVESKAMINELCEGIQSFRKYYSDLMEKQMRLQNFDLFGEMEAHLKKSFYTDRERVHYNIYQDGCDDHDNIECLTSELKLS